MAPPLAELRAVSRWHEGKRRVMVLQEVSLAVERGEILAVVGPSGSGKTTLLHLLGALDRPSSGQISVAGMDLAGLDDERLSQLRRDRIGFVFQFFNLLPTLSAVENVALPLRLSGVAPAPASEEAAKALERVGLEARRHHLPDELSGGEQQRVAIARALIRNPGLVLADEPTGNLDSENGRQIMRLLVDVAAQADRAVVLATHDPQATSYCDRVVHLCDGRIREIEEIDRRARAAAADQPA